MMAQVLILRELLVLAQGQELKLALGLWCWLWWTGWGSLLGGRSGGQASPARLGGLLSLLGLLLPLTILATRALPAMALLPWGQSLPPLRALVLFLALLAPFGSVSGYFFPQACRVLASFYLTGVVGRVYYLETLGAALGAGGLSIFLLGHFSHLTLSLGTGVVLALGGWVLAGSETRGWWKQKSVRSAHPTSAARKTKFCFQCNKLKFQFADNVGLFNRKSKTENRKRYKTSPVSHRPWARQAVPLQFFSLLPLRGWERGFGTRDLGQGSGKEFRHLPTTTENRKPKTQNLLPRLACALNILLLGAALCFSPRLEEISRQWQWPGRQLAAVADSPYALLTATREAEQISFFVNNLWYFTYPDPLTAEHQAHLGLLQHPQPRRVLLLGGGVAGLLPEILKTPGLTRLDYVELDPQLVRLAQGLLPAETIGPGLDPRVRIIFQDARRFLEEAPHPYDVILMALPEPRNAQLNRYYSLEFFQSVARHLEPQGVFSFSLPGAPASLSPLRAAYLALTYHTLGRVFPQVLAFPGERVRFFATAGGALVAAPESLAARLKERRLALQYVREYYLLFDLSRPRQEYLKGILGQHPPEVNTDLNPRCYFYDLALSGLQEGLPLPEILSALHRLPPALPWLALALATILLGALLRGRTGPLCLYQALIIGLGAMALEILGLILYQIHQGYLYRQMGLLIAGFMGGMAAGGALGNVLARRIERAPGLLAGLQGSMATLALFLALVLPRISGSVLPGGWVLSGCVLVLAAGGAAAGGGFVLCAALWVHSRAEAGAKGGALYAVDLLGATLGALGVSLVVLPVWGILPVLYLLAALHAGAAVMMVCGLRVKT